MPLEILGPEPEPAHCLQDNPEHMKWKDIAPIQLAVEASGLNVSGFLTISKVIRRTFSPGKHLTLPSARTRSLPVQTMEGFGKEFTVFSDQLAIEPDLASSMITALDAHHVPVHL